MGRRGITADTFAAYLARVCAAALLFFSAAGVWLYMRAPEDFRADVAFSLLISGAAGATAGAALSLRRRGALRRQLDREVMLDLFSRHVPVAVAMLDGDLRYIACSYTWLEYCGIAGQDLIGKAFAEGHAAIENPNSAWYDNCLRALAGEMIEVEQDSYTLEGGEVIYVRYQMRRWLDGAGRTGGVIVFGEKITDQVLARAARERMEEELKRSNRELEQFAYTASHDLRAPLRGVASLAQWIEEDAGPGLDPGIREKLETMRGRIARMEALLNDILKYARAGASGDAESVDVAALVAAISDSGATGPRFRVTAGGRLPALRTPRTPLEQVFSNLIVNAARHHDREEGEIRVSCAEKGEFYEFCVEDDGPGIPPEFHERVFQMFQTLQPRDKKDGSGLGLSIVRKIVEWQGGRVWIEPRAAGARGTAFRFLWPREPRERKVQDAA